jgi:hypothetical protein
MEEYQETKECKIYKNSPCDELNNEVCKCIQTKLENLKNEFLQRLPKYYPKLLPNTYKTCMPKVIEAIFKDYLNILNNTGKLPEFNEEKFTKDFIDKFFYIYKPFLFKDKIKKVVPGLIHSFLENNQDLVIQYKNLTNNTKDNGDRQVLKP